MDTLSGAIAEAAAGLGRQRTLLAVLFLDLDRFKEVNDTFGHAEGDALLRDVAERLRRFQTPSIFCARAGGDEFALVLRDTTERAAEALANSLLNLLSMPHQIHGRPVSLGASIGIATMNSPADSADVLLAYADAAMYAAKAAGRSQVRVYRHELSPGLQERNALRGDIQAALDGNQFELHFQPQVDMRNGAICGAEALLRWRHPSRGLLGPASFLDVLLDSPQELALTEWVVDTTCWHLSEWLTIGLPIPKVCLNLSARQLLAPNLAATLVRLCQSHGVPPERLEVEITEHADGRRGPGHGRAARTAPGRDQRVAGRLRVGPGQHGLSDAGADQHAQDRQVLRLGAGRGAHGHRRDPGHRPAGSFAGRARWPKAWRPRRSARCCRTRAATRCRAICSAAPAPGRLRRDDRRRDRRRHSGQG